MDVEELLIVELVKLPTLVTPLNNVHVHLQQLVKLKIMNVVFSFDGCANLDCETCNSQSNFICSSGRCTCTTTSCVIPFPYANYTFDSIQGGIVTDHSGNGHDGTIRGDITLVTGKRNGAVEIIRYPNSQDVGDQYIDIGVFIIQSTLFQFGFTLKIQTEITT
mgnify:CR=1 FL=1